MDMQLHYYTEPYMLADAARGSNGLLAALREHHDFNMVPPRKWREKKAASRIVRKVEPIDPEPFYPQMWFYDLIRPGKSARKIDISLIKEVVCRHYGVRQIDITSERRTADIVKPRQIAFYLCKRLTERSYPQIGRQFGGRDHTTVLHAFNKINGLVARDHSIGAEVVLIEAKIKLRASA